jgi:hypothetical protein
MTTPIKSKGNKFATVVVDEVHSNVSQEIIEITSDRLTIILTKHIDHLQKSKEWQMPLSLFLTIILVLSTSTFKNSFGLPPETWSAIFIISCTLTLIWLFTSILKNRKAMTIEDFLRLVKNQA